MSQPNGHGLIQSGHSKLSHLDGQYSLRFIYSKYLLIFVSKLAYHQILF